MRWWTILQLRWRSLFGATAVERELDAELQFHLQQEIESRVAAGESPEAARRAALLTIGGLDQVKEACRDEQRVRPLQDLVQDVRYAVRLLRRAPALSAVAILTLALGIGANTAMFSVVHTVLLAPLPYPDADRIIVLGTRNSATGRVGQRMTGGDLADLLEERGPIERIGTYYGGKLGVQVSGNGQFADTYFVTPDFFRVFGLAPLHGRLLTERDMDRGAVIAKGFAARAFGSTEGALGKQVQVEGQTFEIVGVVPGSFQVPRNAELWLATTAPRHSENRTAFNYQAVAKVRGGETLESTRTMLRGVSQRLAAAAPDSNRDRVFTATRLQDSLVSRARTTLVLLMAAVSLVLAIACVNVANLLLARATTRWREVALRAALGASRWRVIRQLASESLVLAVIGGTLGLLLAYVTTPALVRLAPDTLPRLDEVRVSTGVFVFAASVSVLASLLFGLVPAWQASRVALNESIKQGSAKGLVGRSAGRLGQALIVSEIALASVLAIGAGLLGRTLGALTTTELGFNAQGVAVMTLHIPARGLEQYVKVAAFSERLFPELRAIPGVAQVGATMGLPAGPYGSNGTYWVEGRTERQGEEPEAGFVLASPSYFAAMGIPLLKGREFDSGDRYETEFVAIVSESLARRSFPGEDPIGRRIRCGLDAPDKWMTIVGVVGDVRPQPSLPPGSDLYMPLAQHPFHANESQVVLRTSGDPAALVEPAREVMRRLYPDAAVSFTTLSSLLDTSIAAPVFRAVLVGGFAGLALLLAMAGVYGVMAHVTAERTAEFGLRMALGGRPAQLFRLVAGRAWWLTAVGLVLGLAVSVGVARYVESLLFELDPVDPTTYAVVAVVVFAMASLATAVPAWRASRIDPVVALRSE